MGTGNYKTGLVLSERCVGLEDKAAVVTGGQVTVELRRGLQWEEDTWHNTYVSKSEIR